MRAGCQHLISATIARPTLELDSDPWQCSAALGAAYNWNILIPRAAIVMLLLLTRIPQHILSIIIYIVSLNMETHG